MTGCSAAGQIIWDYRMEHRHIGLEKRLPLATTYNTNGVHGLLWETEIRVSVKNGELGKS